MCKHLSTLSKQIVWAQRSCGLTPNKQKMTSISKLLCMPEVDPTACEMERFSFSGHFVRNAVQSLVPETVVTLKPVVVSI